ncbi:MFS transporter [Streptomyces zhihengii]
MATAMRGAEATGAAPERPPARRNTAVLVAFTAATNLADGVLKMALPMLAAELTDSPARVAAVSLTLTAPWLLIALHVGVLVDRLDRRRLLWAANALRLAAVGWLAAAAAAGGLSPAQLLLTGAVLGVADVIAGTAGPALVPAAVPREARGRVNAWMSGAETVCQEFAGPFAGGLLMAAGTGLALGATWIAYAVAALALPFLAGRFRAERGTAAPVSVNARIAEGLRFLWRHHLLRTMSLVLTALCAVWGGWLALIPLYAKQEMGLDADEYGLVLSALGVGGLTGALAVTAVNRLLGVRWAMFADLLGTAAMAALPALTTQTWAVAAGAFLGGMGGTLWTVNSRTIGQRLVPDELLGRFGAASRLFGWGAMPLGAGLAGVIGELVSPRAAFVVLALLAAATVVPFLRTVTPAALRAEG